MPPTIVVSRSPSKNPEHRWLEDGIVQAIQSSGGADVLLIPHAYNLKPNDDAVRELQRCDGDLVVCAWLYARSLYWVLDSLGVRGRFTRASWDGEHQAEPTTLDHERAEMPARSIFCLDLRVHPGPEPFVEEINRLVKIPASGEFEPRVRELPQESRRRWYPVIDYSRCTNCMECIDFCLFGVYGIDDQERILVEQADNCRKGCPACSRVCPENAIIFPQHKTPAIAGAFAEPTAVKIDLSSLLGGSNSGGDPAQIAARERDEHLLIAGRKLAEKAAELPKDELDELIDELDKLDL